MHWETMTPIERANWVRAHLARFGRDTVKRLFGLSDWAITNIAHGGEWIAAYDQK